MGLFGKFFPARCLRPLLICMSVLLLTCGASAQKRRIAVLSFDVGSSAKQHAESQFGIRDDLGRELSDVLIDRLVQDGKFVVVERTALDKIIKEQNASNSDRVDPASAAKIGKIAGVDAIVIGSVSEFGVEKKESKWNMLTRNAVDGTGFNRTTSTVSVAITGRLIDVNTATILVSATGAGTSSKTQTVAQTVSTGRMGQTSSDFSDPMVAEATNHAIATLTAQLETEISAMPAPPPAARQSYSGIIADVTGNTLILTVGTSAGVHIGDTVEISRPVRTVKHPQTGAVLKVVTEHLGSAKVTEADATSATAVLSAPASVKVNDQVSCTP